MTEMKRPVLIASNRGPVSFEPLPEGGLLPSRGGGGLVTALTGVLQVTGGLWVASAMTEGDREKAARSPEGRMEVVAGDAKYQLRYLVHPPEVFDHYYNVISNRMMWFVHHYLWDTVRWPQFGPEVAEAWQDYVRVNQAFAHALAEEGARQATAPAYLVQDYHLALVPRFLRQIQPDALIAHFSHTPFAGPTYLRVLPTAIRVGLLRGLLGADVLGFQSEAWSESFLLCCRWLAGARVDLYRRRVTFEGRPILVRRYPISVEAGPLWRLSGSPEVRRIRRELERWRGGARLLLRVDRTELSKNILRGFLAYETFLKRTPSWRGRVKFLALLSPSRQDVPEYRTYTDECLAAASRINAELGEDGWQPIQVDLGDDYAKVIAAYGLYDTLLVNPVFDGMNLVAMEGPLVSRRQGVLILSRNAGAFFRLGRHALTVNPFDVVETADAIGEALTMPQEERARRARGLRRTILRNPPSRWVERQLADLERVAASRPGT